MKTYRAALSSLVMLICISCGSRNPAGPDNRWREFVYAWGLLDAFYLFQEELPEDPYAYQTPQALYASVQDPYTAYLPPDSARLFLRNLSPRSTGMGITIDSVGPGYVVISVIPGSPAQQAGVQGGDTIVSVNGRSLAGVGREELPRYLRGAVDERKNLRIRRGDQEITLTVRLREFALPTVFYDSLDANTAYIGLTGFFENTIAEGGSAQEFDSALQSTAWAGFTILDLRGNPGGEVEQCIRITSQFLSPQTPLVRTEERAYLPQEDTVRTVDSIWYSIDVGGRAINRRFHVLINTSSASAAEILVAGLHANRPDIVTLGTRTYGKARGQIISITPDSGLARVTYARVEPIQGESYDLVGIDPKVPVSAQQDALQVSLDLVDEGLAKRISRSQPVREWEAMTGGAPLLVKRATRD